MYNQNSAITRKTNLLISISNHVSDSPALILKETAQRCQQNAMAGLLLLGDLLGNRNENVNSKQADTVLVVARQVLEERNYFFNDGFAVHFLHELGQVVRRLSSHHRGFIVYQSSKVLSERLL